MSEELTKEQSQEASNDQAVGQNREQVEKAKKNLIYVGMFSVIMFFAGFSSAYIVSMGDSFWLKVGFPSAFFVSTALLLASSVAMIISLRLARKGNTKGLKIAILTTFMLGLSFCYFQYKGYTQLIDNGVHFTFNGIIVTDGRYGDYFEVKKGDDFVGVNGNSYELNGKKMNDAEMKGLQDFMSQFTKFDEKKPFKVKSYGEPYTLLFKSGELSVDGTTLVNREGEELEYLDRQRLFYLARNVRDARGDFFVGGEMGKDFHVYYKGEELEYRNRQLFWKGAILSPYLQVKIMESSDSASSYMYILTLSHLLHVLVTMFFLLKAVIHSFTGRINGDNTIGLNMTSIFWHFLGLLWVYLLLFLLFIH
ncbi:MAG: cytochrome c oxidase subunit 3 [Flavobacteriaceae bacterium]|jgi:cytochrome c oxidase subunit 3